jgi:hypothetical protein
VLQLLPPRQTKLGGVGVDPLEPGCGGVDALEPAGGVPVCPPV